MLIFTILYIEHMLYKMMVAITTMLVSVAELSNIFSVLAVFICFCAMVLFIMRNMMVFRLHGEDLVFGVPVHASQQPIPQMKMMKVHIPFTFKLLESTQTSVDDLQFTVSSQVPYSLLAFWGVSIRELHLLLWQPWSFIQAQALAGNLMRGYYQQTGISREKAPHSDDISTLYMPQPTLNLGTPPRLCYPLVVLLVRSDKQSLHPDETVALINVMHIKDAVCTLPTSILAQYLKQANGQLSCLKQLYLATGNPLSYSDDEEPSSSEEGHGTAATLLCPGEEDEPGSVWNSSGEQLCVVCQYFPLSRALLPCRHTCICASCFGKLERCPMCRSPIKSYFCIREEEYMPDEAGSGVSKPSPTENFFQILNNRFTEFFGFR